MSRRAGPPTRKPGSAAEVLWVFSRLGLTSFGGPVAHLGYLRTELVERRRWLTDEDYADLVALCHVLPGPTSSQVGMALGLRRAGRAGLLAAWLGFTLPSAIALTAFALGLAAFGDADGGWLQGVKAAAVAVVAHAVVSMARTLTPDWQRALIAVAALVAALAAPHALTQVGVIVAGAVAGWIWLRAEPIRAAKQTAAGVSRTVGALALALFAGLLIALPALQAATDDPTLRLVDVFYRAGSLVFGGGHVVLPLLESQTVSTGLVDQDVFLAGYGAAQAVPGPLFTFAAHLGASMTSGPSGVAGATIALVAIFAPAALLIVGVLPFWDRLRGAVGVRRALMGVNAAVVGILTAALWDPVITRGVVSTATLLLAVAAFVALAWARLPAWAVVLTAALLGALLT